jgi:hypothetical protein
MRQPLSSVNATRPTPETLRPMGRTTVVADKFGHRRMITAIEGAHDLVDHAIIAIVDDGFG